MMQRVRLGLGGIGLAALAGCGIGYDRTLFVTKTNAGFEASTQPPTLQLDIDRLEGVVAPQFEQGKKLPVMASFKFQNDGIFSPAVGSTFATGDAATTLAGLYKDDPSELKTWTQRAEFLKGTNSGGPKFADTLDSTVTLNEAPEIRHWLLPKWLEWTGHIPILGPVLRKPEFQTNDVRPVFFGTDTVFGLKVQWSGMTGQFPDTVKLGYNRKELALVPITLTDDTKLRMASLLATVDSASAVQDAAKSKIQFLQYFATGDAATLLAMQHDVRRAMLLRLDPNAEKLTATLSDLSQLNPSVAGDLLATMYDAFERLSDPLTSTDVDDKAAAHKRILDSLVDELRVPSTKPAHFEFNPTNHTLSESDGGSALSERSTFRTTLAYRDTLLKSWRALARFDEEIKDSATESLVHIRRGANSRMRPTSEQIDARTKMISPARSEFFAFDTAVTNNQHVKDAFAYYVSLLGS